MFVPDSMAQYIVVSHFSNFDLEVAVMDGACLAEWLEMEGAVYDNLLSRVQGTVSYKLANGRVAMVRLYNARGATLSNFHRCEAVYASDELSVDDLIRLLNI